MKITFEHLKAICPNIPQNADVFVSYLNETCERYGIDTPRKKAAFIAQLAHESGQFRYTQEIASGKAYEGRKDLGNVYKGDGVRFKGRGLIQITGRTNYYEMGKKLGADFVATPTLLQAPRFACLSAGEFWVSRKLNEFAELPDTWRSNTKKFTPFQYITYRINGGLNGLEEREKYYNKALQVFLVQP